MLLGVVAQSKIAQGAGDPLWNKVTSLVVFDGNGTTFTDKKSDLQWQIVSPAERVTGAYGKALSTLNNPSPQSGSAAGYATTVSPTTAQLEAFNFGSGPFCIEMHVRVSTINTDAYATLVEFQNASYKGWSVYSDRAARRVLFYESFTSDQTLTGADNSLPVDELAHIAITRDTSNVLRIFSKGKIVASEANHNQTHTRLANQVWVALQFANSGARASGVFEQIRVTKGDPRYVTEFTPPTGAFPTSQYVSNVPPQVKQIGTTFRQDSPARKTSLTAVTAGSYLIACAGTYQSILTDASGTKNGAFTRLFEVVDGNDNRLTFFGKANAVAGDETITFTTDGGADYTTGVSLEVANCSAVEKTISALNTLTVGDSVPANRLFLLGTISDTGGDQAFGVPAGFTLISRENNGDNFTPVQFCYKVVAAAETINAVTTAAFTADQYDNAVLVFKG